MKTLLTNKTLDVSIQINTSDSKAEQFRTVSANPKCDIGRTSFMNLLSGKALESKGWVLEVIKPEPKVVEAPKTAKIFGMEFKKSEISNTRGTVGGARKRRDFKAVFEKARKSSFGESVIALEKAGFKLCDVQKDQRWFCMNIPKVEVATRKNTRIDISPLKNGNVNFSLYINNRASGVKKTLKADEVSVDAIVKMAQHKDFTGAQA